MTTISTLFWLSLAGVAYSYFVYPVLLRMLAAVVRQKHEFPEQSADSDLPFVSIVIAAYREEAVIEQRLRNILTLDYPADRLEVLIGVDGDLDSTGKIVAGFADESDIIRLVQFPQRRGKASVLNDCVPMTRGEIVAFSDANTNMASDAIHKLVRHFEDPAVGCVCGQLVLQDPETGKNVDGVYWRFENFLKSNEAKIGGLLGVNGAIYALRRELYSEIPAHTIVDDFLIGMRVHLKRRKLVYEPDAQAYEETAPSIEGEFHRRTRIGSGNFQSIQWLWPLLNPLRGSVAFSFFSHKLMRWLCPLFLISALICNALLLGQPVYQILFAIQVTFYTCALIGSRVHSNRGWKKILRIAAMFVAMNAALLVGLYRWIRDDLNGMWRRTERSEEDAVTGNSDSPITDVESNVASEATEPHEAVSPTS